METKKILFNVYQFHLRVLLLVILANNATAQSCGSTMMQGLTASTTRPKVGTECTDTSCPIWYLQNTAGISTISSVVIGEANPDTLTWSDGGNSTTIDPNTLSSGQPDYYGCPSYSPMSTVTYNSGSGTYHNDYDNQNNTFTKQSDGGWTEIDTADGETARTNTGETIDENFYTIIYGYPGPFPFPNDGFGNVELFDAGFTNDADPNTCTDAKSTHSYSQVISGIYSKIQSIADETKNSSPYNTSDLEGHVISLDAAGLATNTAWGGDAKAVCSLPADESSATATQAKWRIQICGTDPQVKYSITWYVHMVNTDGTNTDSSDSVMVRSGIPGEPGVWYYPSPDGEAVPQPSWPSGCPLGGSHTTTYSGPVSVTPDP